MKKLLCRMFVICVLSIGLTACGDAGDTEKKMDSGLDAGENSEFLTESSTEVVTNTEIASESETPVEPETPVESETPAESETPVESETPAESETPVESETPAESEKPIEPEKPAESQKPAYVVNDMDKTMYVSSGVNVRKGPSSDYEKLGKLSKGQQVKVTGKVEDKSWYRIDYNGTEGFVSSKYLQNNPVKEEVAVASRQVKLNAVSLNPQKSQLIETDELIDSIFAEILTEGMTTYDKVKACYDYLVLNTEYGQNSFAQEIVWAYGIDFYYMYHDDIRAYGVLTQKVGVCDDYSAAFAVMLRKLGVDCYTVGGQYTNSKGESGGHAWCEVNLNGEIYIFDPQIEDRVVSNGKIKYSYFFKTYDEKAGRYAKEQ